MLLYHIFYTCGEVFGYSTAEWLYAVTTPIEPLIAFTFIFVSGICTRLSRSNLKRGGVVFLVALAINLVTTVFLPSLAIKFGVLNLLSVCMILYGVLQKPLEKINPKLGFMLFFVLFVLTWGVRRGYIGLLNFKLYELPRVLYSSEYLFPIGLRSDNFSSADYFPLMPWLFLFLSGSYFWGAVTSIKKKLPEFLYKAHLKPLAKIGKYSLYIYIIHQPIIFGAVYAVEFIRNSLN